MTDQQRQQALALCDRILDTAAKLQADLHAAAEVIEEEIRKSHPAARHPGSCEAAVRNP
jgi:hypothetical protein